VECSPLILLGFSGGQRETQIEASLDPPIVGSEPLARY
jgi:hypothetical protein